MKKTILSIAIALTVFSTAFAKAPVKVKDLAAASFQKDFSKASDVQWSTNKNYLMASFQVDNETQFAY